MLAIGHFLPWEKVSNAKHANTCFITKPFHSMQNDCIMPLKVKVQILTFREKGATFLALGKTHIWHYFSIICTEFVLRGAKNLGQFVREKSDIIFFDVYGYLVGILSAHQSNYSKIFPNGHSRIE